MIFIVYVTLFHDSSVFLFLFLGLSRLSWKHRFNGSAAIIGIERLNGRGLKELVELFIDDQNSY